MTEKLETHVLISPEVETFLAENSVSILEIIKHANVDASVKIGRNPVNLRNQEKDAATIIIASAAVIAALTPILKEVLRSFSGKNTIVREKRLLPVEDSDGSVVLDASGNPLLHWVDVAKGVVPHTAEQKIAIKGPLGIEISFGSD